MKTPKRIQRRRVKNWRTPPGAVYVGRPSKWGNPVRVMGGDYQGAANFYEHWLKSNQKLLRQLNELRGKHLVCWCPLDKPCHGDVLLRLANELDEAETEGE